jgi:hypothetical protein
MGWKMSFKVYLIGIIFGIGMGYFVQRASLCFSVGIGEFFSGRGKNITQMFLIIFAVTALGFIAIGIKPVGQIRGYGLFNVLSGMFFGAGIIMSGGCILGSLRQLGEGNLSYLLVILAMIPGMAVVVYAIDPILTSWYKNQQLSIGQALQLPNYIIVTPLIIAALTGTIVISKRRKKR